MPRKRGLKSLLHFLNSVLTTSFNGLLQEHSRKMVILFFLKQKVQIFKLFQQILKRLFYAAQDPYQEKVPHGLYNLYRLL